MSATARRDRLNWAAGIVDAIVDRLSALRVSRRAAKGKRGTLRWRKFVIGDRVLVKIRNQVTPVKIETAPAALLASRVVLGPQEEPYSRPDPIVFGAPEELVLEHRDYRSRPALAPQGGLAFLNNATIAASGVVFAADGRVVSESLINSEHWTSFGVFTRARLSDPFRVDLPAVSYQRRLANGPYVLLKQTYDANYGHWLIEGLPRLAFAADYLDLSQCRVIVSGMHDGMHQIYIDSVAAFGVAEQQIEMVDYTPVHVDELIYPLPMSQHPWVKAPRIAEILESVPRRLGVTGAAKRLYVSRNLGATRRLINEDEIVEIVQRRGFTIVHPETMSFAEQVRTFCDAELVVGNYGAGLSNIAFAPRGTILFALTTEFMQDDFFWDLMAHKQGRYISLHGKASDPGGGYHSDFVIDAKLFARLLDDCIGARKAR